MKISLYITLGIACAFATASLAQTPDKTITVGGSSVTATPGAFIGIDAGAFRLQDLTVNAVPVGVNFRFKTDWGLTMPVGYDFGNGFSLSFSAGYYDSRIDGVVGQYGGRSQTAQVNGGLEFVPLLVNASYHVPLTGKLNWFVGVGAGAVYENASFSAYDNPGNRSITYGQFGGQTVYFGGLSDTSWSFGLTAFTGLSYDLTPTTSVNLGYRYLHVNDSVSVDGNSSSDFNGQSVELGLSWKL